MESANNNKRVPTFKRWGFEWKTKVKIFNLPLIHIAIGFNSETGKLYIAKGVVAIGFFGLGLISIAWFGVGFLLGMGQFAVGIIAIAQFAFGIYFGLGQFATGVIAIGQFAFGDYVLAQIGYGKHVWSSIIEDTSALEFFKNIF